MRTEGTSTGGGHGPIVSKVAKPEPQLQLCSSISGLVVEYIVAIDVTRVRFPADAWWQHHAALPAAARKAVLALAVKLPRSGRDIKCGPGHVDRAGCFMEECESAHPVHNLQVEPLAHVPSPVAVWQPVFTGAKRLHF